MADPTAAVGFMASILTLGLGVAASTLVCGVVGERFEMREAETKGDLPPDFGPDTIQATAAWAIDSVTAITTLIGPMVAFVFLFPSLGVQIATLLNLTSILVSFWMFVAIVRQKDPSKWVATYRFWGQISLTTLVGMFAYAVLGILAWLLATPASVN